MATVSSPYAPSSVMPGFDLSGGAWPVARFSDSCDERSCIATVGRYEIHISAVIIAPSISRAGQAVGRQPGPAKGDGVINCLEVAEQASQRWRRRSGGCGASFSAGGLAGSSRSQVEIPRWLVYRAAAAEFEVDGLPALIAAPAPAMRQAGDYPQAAALLRAVFGCAAGRRAGRPVVADFDSKRACFAANADLESAAFSRSGVLDRVRAQLRGQQDRIVDQRTALDGFPHEGSGWATCSGRPGNVRLTTRLTGLPSVFRSKRCTPCSR